MMGSSATWQSQDPTLSIGSQDDFEHFLDMGMSGPGDSLQFDFQDFNHHSGQGGQSVQHDHRGSLVGKLSNGRHWVEQDTPMHEHIASMAGTSSRTPMDGSPMVQAQSSNDDLADLDAQIQYLQRQKQQQQQRRKMESQQNYYAHHRYIPPTPNSVEMNGSNNIYSSSEPQHTSMFDRYRAQRDQEIAFTPLASPAVTPLDTHFTIPEYTIPGAYFSPLSSPALQAQNDHISSFRQRHHSMSMTNSPIDTPFDTHSAPGSGVIFPRKSSKPITQKPRTPRGVRQSPIVKPRKTKRSMSSTIPAQTLGDIREFANAKSTSTTAPASGETSENGSISPEHLSDMAPPPVPASGSVHQSPSILAQKGSVKARRVTLGSPATPASLMKLTQSPTSIEPTLSNDMDIDENSLESFNLPEAIHPAKPALSRIDTDRDGQATPTMTPSGTRTPAFGSLPSPTFTRPNTATSSSQSPQIETMNSSRKTPQITPRGSKKRGSTSNLVSPALLPRISPGMKPLLPGGGTVSEDTASLLLASKSNYQNILEGTHLPGVSYPTELSTNLTSKRTSHKIAEQGRRNRINYALQEIATLLPPKGLAAKDSGGEKSGGCDAEGGDGVTNKAAQTANSKASTVELAIEYIKQLQTALAETTRRAEMAERELEGKECG